VEVAPGHLPYFITLMWAGLRPGEGLALTADKINMAGRSMLIDAQIGQHKGLERFEQDGDGTEGPSTHKRPKDGEERTVEVSDRLAALLSRVIKARSKPTARVVSITGERAEATDAKTPKVGPWLFYPDLGPSPNEKDAQRVYKNALRAMRRALVAAGLPAHYSLHSLRHTYGSLLISKGYRPPTSNSRWDTLQSR
jgi:integrase